MTRSMNERVLDAALQEQMMGPRSDAEMAGRDPMFRDHNCYRCKDGAEPCKSGSPRGCEYPRARND